ncbi:MAG: GNAT family N-acetyltransferase [Methylotenera sp.]|nr:GNAT family N-acetyltransferase [Oligoflexia bacterium]
MLRLETPRLILIASTQEQVRDTVLNPQRFAQEVGAQLTSEWPPKNFHPFAPDIFAQMTSFPSQVGWWVWWILKRPEAGVPQSPVVIGYVGFKGAPTQVGSVEATYELTPSLMGRGYAGEALGALVQWAFTQPKVKRIVADTTPENMASKRTLEKCGFRFLELESDEDELVYLKLKAG